MLTRGARAERQGNLRLLESTRLETDEKRKQLELKHAAIHALTPAQAEEAWARIRAMSVDDIVDFFQGYPLRMAGKNALYYVCWDPRETTHKDDPEMAAAVEAVNLALHAYDKARLNLRVAELFGGRVSPWKPEANSEFSARSKSALIELDLLWLFISGAKAVSFYESLAGGDLHTIERENFKQFGLPNFRARANGKMEESTEWDRAHGEPRDALL